MIASTISNEGKASCSQTYCFGRDQALPSSQDVLYARFVEPEIADRSIRTWKSKAHKTVCDFMVRRQEVIMFTSEDQGQDVDANGTPIAEILTPEGEALLNLLLTGETTFDPLDPDGLYKDTDTSK